MASFVRTKLDISVLDYDSYGYYIKFLPQNRGIICINPRLSYKSRYFVLLHELGHICYWTKGGNLKEAKHIRDEAQANTFAMQICTKEEVPIFIKLYERAIKRNYMDSWDELLKKQVKRGKAKHK